MGYPTKAEEQQIVEAQIRKQKPSVMPVVNTDQILKARDIVHQVYIDEKIHKYIVDIVFATRFPAEAGLPNLRGMISNGASPRASINIALAARAYAFIKHRGFVIPEDVRAVCHDVLRHRIALSYEAEANNLIPEEIISEILNKVQVP